uniref:Acetyl-coenzyme A carboxylase carboxyl transferase subunit alpha n=1 Tax=Cyanidium caldarium TaxID=2771 RepID=ACCA_CYACA|nr:acetyl-CoA carboxylase carboxyltransferase alpha subunit [Cyanidium caldarium]O19903.1 RecName: Full=Acetyl-coenzyme A carboxylase carboxyl transferase subunit alpha; Short=ACCase subunit alpha; Short=Acetyl-CoA carboxylase carboxyltransferase subunit alpha [Cyanidium caldarium]AAB82686.1 unknown [Cyanidium caldarium]WDB00202.1 acetyl-CoA carboxylase carboxyltransferase alphasubunit [Cyanidium caldarium]
MKMLDKTLPLEELESSLTKTESKAYYLSKLVYRHDKVVNNKAHILQRKLLNLKKQLFYGLTSYQKLCVARHKRRPTTLDYIEYLLDSWIELHGDRRGSDDPAIITGIGRIGRRSVVVLGQQKGRNTKENVLRNFGMSSPGGYRKALRVMEHANKFKLPILTFIDTPGALAGVSAEKSGQAEAIATNLKKMFSFEVPIISTIIGEGGSGGALGICIGNYVMMFENSIYTVATPEACSSILWKDSTKAADAAEALKVRAEDLLTLKIIDEIIPEPFGVAHDYPLLMVRILKNKIRDQLDFFDTFSPSELKHHRYLKFRKLGLYYDC